MIEFEVGESGGGRAKEPLRYYQLGCRFQKTFINFNLRSCYVRGEWLLYHKNGESLLRIT